MTTTLVDWNQPTAEAFATRLQRDIPGLTAAWQRRLEIQKNSISVFVPVEVRRRGLLVIFQLLVEALKSGLLDPFREKAMAIARLRAGQGFNLKDSLDEALVLEDLLFRWACEGMVHRTVPALDVIAIIHKVSHMLVQDIAQVHVQVVESNLRQRQQESFTDGLTGLFNHRFFKEFLQKEIFRSQRYQHETSLVLIDVDHFKQVNDRWGHTGGDQILTALAKLAQGNCRVTDLVCRYGGEEFAIVLPETPKAQAIAYCERLRSTIERHAFEVKHLQKKVHATVSLGLANYPIDTLDAAELILKADQALYRAKHKGRNRVGYFDEEGACQSAEPAQSIT